MNLSDVLASEEAHIRAKEAEALAILTASAGPAMQMLDGAKREFGQALELRDLGVFVSPRAQNLYENGKRNATRFLFDTYATTVFRLVPDAETFVTLLSPINERVVATLTVIDRHEAELCRLEWVKLAWERAEPTAIRKAWNRLRALMSRSDDSSGSDRTDDSGRALDQVVYAQRTPHSNEQNAAVDPTAEGVPFKQESPAASGNDSLPDRRTAVDSYIDEVLAKTGKRITRTDIWKSVGYRTRTEFERWERNDEKNPNKSAHERFTKILTEKPHLK